MLRNYLQHLLQHWAGEHLFNEELLQEYGFYMVGAASSREYRISIELSRFIAAGSRSQCYNTAVKSKSVVEVLTNNKISPNSNLQRCKRVWDLVVYILKFI